MESYQVPGSNLSQVANLRHTRFDMLVQPYAHIITHLNSTLDLTVVHTSTMQ